MNRRNDQPLPEPLNLEPEADDDEPVLERDAPSQPSDLDVAPPAWPRAGVGSVLRDPLYQERERWPDGKWGFFFFGRIVEGSPPHVRVLGRLDASSGRTWNYRFEAHFTLRFAMALLRDHELELLRRRFTRSPGRRERHDNGSTEAPAEMQSNNNNDHDSNDSKKGPQ